MVSGHVRPFCLIRLILYKVKMNKVFLTLFIMSVMGGLRLSAQTVVPEWRDSTQLRLKFVLADGDSVGGDYAVRAVPMLTGGKGDTLRLKPVVFRGKRNMRYIERARYYGTAPAAVGDEVAAGSEVAYDVTLTRAEHPWLWGRGGACLTVGRTKEGCCDVIPMTPVSRGCFVYVPPFVPMLANVPDNTGKAGELERSNPVLQHISKYRPYDSSRILRKEKGALYVHFPLDKWLLLHDFRDNAATLDRIVSITRDIMADTTSTVKTIQIIGLASVEGSVERNRRLAGNRAAALKAYIQRMVPTPDSLYECVNGGEAWTELRDQIADTDCQWRDALLAIIDNETDPDRRERRIKTLDNGRAYAYLKDNVLGDQRNSGYMRIYYDYVPDHAARTINAATELLRQGRYDEAKRMLLTVKADRRSWNALGVAYYMTGGEAEALDWFRRSAADGNPQAKDNLRQAEEIKARR